MLHRLRRAGLVGAGVRGRQTASAAPGTGTATPARAATSRASTTRYSFDDELQQEWEWTRALRRRSPRSCATSTTSPTASTCAATSSSTRGSTAADVRRGRRAAGRSTTDNGDARHGALRASWRSAACRPPNMPDVHGPRALRGRLLPHRPLAARGRRLHRQARRRHRHRLVGDPGDPGDRRSRPTHLTVFQRTPNFSVPGAQRPARPEDGAGASRPTTPSIRAARRASRDFGFELDSTTKRGAGRSPTRSASASSRRAGTTAASAFWLGATPTCSSTDEANDDGRRVRPRQDPRDRRRPGDRPSC